MPAAAEAFVSTCELCFYFSSSMFSLQRAAERGFVDDIIDPKDTRRRLCEDLETLRGKEWTGLKKKHGNIPL